MHKKRHFQNEYLLSNFLIEECQDREKFDFIHLHTDFWDSPYNPRVDEDLYELILDLEYYLPDETMATIQEKILDQKEELKNEKIIMCIGDGIENFGKNHWDLIIFTNNFLIIFGYDVLEIIKYEKIKKVVKRKNIIKIFLFSEKMIDLDLSSLEDYDYDGFFDRLCQLAQILAEINSGVASLGVEDLEEINSDNSDQGDRSDSELIEGADGIWRFK